ncbi:hypothetical protein FB451DRAFT_1392482 [Mycena latifolia]|nr:hypothetical protein FB451DRAFT_1392482 [Mycena latifolia]
MFSTRFIAFIVASVATLAVVHGAPQVNKAAVPAPDAETGTLKLCAKKNYEECDTAIFVEDGCTSLPQALINKLSSATVPSGFVCSFFDTLGGCNADNTPSTILIPPGSADLALAHFDESVNTFKCKYTR